MKGRYKLALFVALVIGALSLLIFFISHSHILLFDPKGIISTQERNLLITAALMMLAVVVPTFIFAAFVAWKYRASNVRAKYAPDLDHNATAGFILWAIPVTLIGAIAVMNWQSTHALDPYKPIASAVKPLTIQVVALRWKWLFIYPEQNIATVNFIEFPALTPLNFELTADAPMNSFWIPQLGGQMYAMAGMSTQLHLMADAPGEFSGSAADMSGQGFAGMRFVAKSAPQADFDAWVAATKSSTAALTLDEYGRLAEPSENNAPASYASVEKGLYNSVMMKFMAPSPSGSMPGMQM